MLPKVAEPILIGPAMICSFPLNQTPNFLTVS